MSKKQFKLQASSSRAVSGVFGAPEGSAFGSTSLGGLSTFGTVSSSTLSYFFEPPDLSAISEPNVIVAFKNLLKKDGTTKSKALDDLHAYVLSLGVEKGGVENAILEAWIKVYPRTSIDSSRRVRQLSHLVQGQISVSCGKRIAKHMSKVVGPWAAGLYDDDRSVVRAAQESFRQVFSTDEKMKNLWNVYQRPLLEYCRNAILKESAQTLSDERTVSPDDAQAKYARVVGSAIMVVSHILGQSTLSSGALILSTPTEKSNLDTLSPDNIRENASFYAELLGEARLWSFASHPDAFVRRATYRLLIATLAKQREALGLAVVSAHAVSASLHIDQTGSAFDYIKALALLSENFPTIWTQYYTGSGKKSATRRLCQFLRKGSQGGPPEYWTYVAKLLPNIPSSVLVPVSESDQSQVTENVPSALPAVLDALHDGLAGKQEPRTNQTAAWNAYLEVAIFLQNSLSSQDHRQRFVREAFIPLLDQYIRPSQDQSRWTVAGQEQVQTCVRAFRDAFEVAQDMVCVEWHRLSNLVIQDVQTSLPEQSKDYAKSQTTIAAETDRWYSLQAMVLKDGVPTSVVNMLKESSLSLIDSAISALKSRSGKPYGAAATLEAAVRLTPELTLNDENTNKIISQFALEDLPALLISPSASSLVALLSLLNDTRDFPRTYLSALRTLFDAADSPAKYHALESLVSSSLLSDSGSDEGLRNTITQSLQQALKGLNERWGLVNAALSNPSATAELTDSLLARMTESLSLQDQAEAGLRGLELAIKHSGQAVKNFVISNEGSILLSRLLYLTQSSDNKLAVQARTLTSAIEGILASEKGSNQVMRSMIETINKGLDTADANSISIDSLVDQAQKLLQNTPESGRKTAASEILPNRVQWSTALIPFLDNSPNVSLSITNVLGGAIYMLEEALSPLDALAQGSGRDAHGYSPALRMALYTVELINSTDIFDHAAAEERAVTYQYLALITQIAGDNLSLFGSNALWDSSSPDVEIEMAKFVASAQRLLVSWLQLTHQVEQNFAMTALDLLLESSRGSSVTSYYNARAYSVLAAEMIELHGHTSSGDEASQLRAMRKTSEVFYATAFITKASEPQGLLRLCNELVADLTGQDLHENMQEGLRQFILLNGIIQKQDNIVQAIPQQRLVFFVKHVISQLAEGSVSKPVASESFKTLTVILPFIKVYGAFWGQIVSAMVKSWSVPMAQDDTNVAPLHASLQICATLNKMSGGDANDDLQDVWISERKSLVRGLLGLMGQLQDLSDESHQPRRTVNSLLARLIGQLSPGHVEDPAEVYPVLASESSALQQSAFNILHHDIPAKQEQISLEIALSGTEAKLPEELLSLILAAPSLDSLLDSNFERTMPSDFRSYLLSWKLIFDHFTRASLKLKADYAASIKEGTYLKSLLDFTFDVLIQSRHKPIDASRFDIKTYTLDTEDSPEKELHWLLIHLYYLCLKHLPTLSKSWWRDCESRATVLAVEAWTEKYVSPLVISSELATVSSWIPTQASDDQPLTIKVFPKAREITAGFDVDEQTMSIAIRLPPTYPLHQVTVEGVNRVGVDEKKWRSWLITTQGVINFSNGSLIDGLLAWKKNVTGALKGQTECAICYSIISADRQLPNKRCQTCKNLFHSGCLFRWFKSSNSSSCPLCRNAFTYG